MKKILVPTDFSEQASYAMNLACQIAEKSGAVIQVFHLIDMSGFIDYSAIGNSYSMLGTTAGIGFDEKILKSFRENAEEKLDDFVKQYEDRGVEILTKIEFGSPLQFINQEITESDYELVVIGSKGASGVEEYLVGSNTEKVVRHSKCPVLTVKSDILMEDINDIVYASKFTKEEGYVAEELKKLQNMVGAKIHLVRIVTPNHFETSRTLNAIMKKYVAENGIENYTLNVYNDVVEEDGIIYFAQQIGADLIAMTTHGRTGLMHLLSGSLAEDVVNHAKRPVWTYKLKH